MYRSYIPNQKVLFPQDVRDFLGPNHEAALICEAVNSLREVDPQLKGRFAVGQSNEGRPAFDPVMMLSLLCYAYAIGIRSSRKIARLPLRDMGAYWLTAAERPDFRTVCLFRVQNKRALEEVFAKVLVIASQLGLLQLGVLAIDGTKIRANVRSSMSTVDQLDEKQAGYRKQIQEIMQEVERNDLAEDQLFGKERDGTEFIEEASSETGRRKKVKEIASQLRQERKTKEAKDLQRAVRMVERIEKAKEAAQERSKTKKASSTDPDARFMKAEGGRIVPGYNAQAVVEEKSRLIVGGTVLQDANDSYAGSPSLEDAETQLGEGKLANRDLVADNGYFNSANIETFVNKDLNFLVKPEGEGNRQYTKSPEDKDKKSDRLTKKDFRFHDRGTPQKSFYVCPKGRHLKFAGGEHLDSATKKNRKKRRKQGFKYRSRDCNNCPFTARCLEKDGRRRTVVRDPVADPHKDRMRTLFQRKDVKRKYNIRMHTVEPVFADIKEFRGFRRFLLRGLKNVNIEWRLACLTHNLLRIARAKARSPTPAPA